MNTTDKKTSRVFKLLMTAGAFYGFFIFGLTDNVKGPVLSEMLSALNLSYSDGSNILFFSYLGFMIATLISGMLADRWGNRTVMAIAGFILALGVGGNGFVVTVTPLYFTFFLLGFGLGTIEIGANGIIVDTYPKKNGFYLNILAFFHGAGSMIAPLFAGKIIADGAGWNETYRLILILPVLLALSFFAARIRGGRIQKLHQSQDLGQGGFFKVLNKDLALFSSILAFYVAAEIGIASWLVEYLQKQKGLSMETSSLYLSLYFAFITGGRLLGSTLVDRIGHLRILRLVSVAAVLVLSLGIFSSHELALIIPITGFFFSIIFPTVTATAAERYSGRKGSVFGVLFFFAGLGGVIGPWAVGIIAEFTSIQWGLSMNILFCLVLFILLLLVPKRPSPK